MAEWFAAFERGDVDGYQSLMTADAWWRCDGCAPPVLGGPYFGGPHGVDSTEARDSRLAYAAHGSLDAACTAAETLVTCDISQTDVFRKAGDLAPYRYGYRFNLEDGSIAELVFISIRPQNRYLPGSPIAAYSAWLQDVHPGDHTDLFLYGTMIVEPADKADRHRQLISDWEAAS